MRTLTIVLCLAALAACKGHPRQTGRVFVMSSRTNPAPPWPVDAAGLLDRFQGAWLMRDEAELGSVAAWEVRGDRVTIWDAKTRKESVSTITFDAPCRYELHQQAGYYEGRFVFDGESLHAGLGDAGVKLGDRILACDDGVVVVVEGTRCVLRYAYNTEWLSEPVECTVTDSTLRYRLPRSKSAVELKLHGNVLADDQLWPNQPIRMSSYAEAKSRATALVTD